MTVHTPRVLVANASKQGSTAAIAEEVGAALREAGADADVRDAGEVRTVEQYDAVVLGSAVYAGRWMEDANGLVDRLEEPLRARPVWLFSSGPLGSPVAKPEGDPPVAADLVERLEARDHRVFAGKLQRKALSFPERAIVTALRAPEGDFRDWDAIEDWAREIAGALPG
jgi:menaquinone-dependent protoporphyrinogen oxidase